jgi:hypothetical protein
MTARYRAILDEVLMIVIEAAIVGALWTLYKVLGDREAAALGLGHSPHTMGLEGSNWLTCLLWNRKRRSTPQCVRTAMQSVPPAMIPITRRPPCLLPRWPRVSHPCTSSPRGQASTACKPSRGVPHRAARLQTAHCWPVERLGEAHQTEIGIHSPISGNSQGT